MGSELETLHRRLTLLLPAEYAGVLDTVEPTPMKSAPLKYGADGRPAWNEMWASYCDLALAGGPPHKGLLLEPGTSADIAADPGRYDEVVAEICRGVGLAADLPADPSPIAGWVRVTCFTRGMAGWLLRAIVMENVAARAHGLTLDLPASPRYRIDKEIKNVITVIAKTAHYWLGHMTRLQRSEIADLFVELDRQSPLLEPAVPGAVPREDLEDLAARIVDRLGATTGVRRARTTYDGWVGLEGASVRDAIWMARALITRNVLARREGSALFVPVDPQRDPDGARVVDAVLAVRHLASAHSSSRAETET